MAGAEVLRLRFDESLELGHPAPGPEPTGRATELPRDLIATIRSHLVDRGLAEIEASVVARDEAELARLLVDADAAIELVEGLMSEVFAVGGLRVPPIPWPRLGYHDALLHFGSDHPDTRFDLEIRDVSDAVRGSAFDVFERVLAGGGAVRALNAGRLELTRAELDGLREVVQRHGARAVAPIRVAGGGWRSNLEKFFGSAQIAGVDEALAAGEGDLLLFVADRAAVAAESLGALRLELADRYALIPAGRHDPLWVDRGRLGSPGYALVVDGNELGGGSSAAGRDAVEARFGFLPEPHGAPPDRGMAFGIDRIVALLGGSAPLSRAPSPADAHQPGDLGLRATPSAPELGGSRRAGGGW